MQRKRIFSGRKRKAQLQLKRAAKRGDISPPPPIKRTHKGRRGPGHASDDPAVASREAAAESARRLQSSFVKLPKKFLEETKVLAATLPLERPIQPEVVTLQSEPFLPQQDAQQGSSENKTVKLTCPQRPKWRYEMSKKEVQQNEEGQYRKWLDQADEIVHDWCDPSEDSSSPNDGDKDSTAADPSPPTMPRAPTSFERNLEVWRQL